MNTTLFEYPKNAAFGRTLPKSKIYEHGSLSTVTKGHFVRQVVQITWQYKLALETINIKGTPSVPEIQVFSVTLKAGELKTEVLRYIDQAIPFPILFELKYGGKVQSIAAYKRPSEADSAKWVISKYFDGDWMAADTPRKPLPMVFNLEALYGYLLTPLMPFPVRTGESLLAGVDRMERIHVKQRELERCKVRLQKEKQFNLKVAINAELRDLQRELEDLTSLLSTSGTTGEY